MTDQLIVRVVPDLASFSVDRGFEYAAGEHNPVVGSLVRVPLSGRPRRGFVVESRTGDPAGLKAVRGVSGDHPVFHPELLASLDELAAYYVAPRAVVLGKTAPPNLPRRTTPPALPSIPPATSPAPEASRAAARGEPGGHVQLLAGGGWADLIRRALTEPLMAGRSGVVVVPTAAEATRLAGILRVGLGDRVLEAEGPDAHITRIWSVAARDPGRVVVGTPRVAWWPVANLGAMILVEEGRRAMKERQTPTVAVSEVAARRAQHEGVTIFHLGRIPTTETLARGAEVIGAGGRLWPPVEIVDRTEDPPGTGLFTERVRAALHAAVRRGHRTLLFTHRHGYAPASRCVTCRELRLCETCGARPDPGDVCRRCGSSLGPCPHCGGRRFEPLGAGVERVVEEANRVVGLGAVGRVGGGEYPVEVGTERDLVAVKPVDLAVAVDGDGLVRGTNYRAAEDALALLARVAGKVRSGAGNRLLVQTVAPGHGVFRALEAAEPVPFLRRELEERAKLGLPPSGEVVVLEITSVETAEADAEIREALADADVFGPALAGERTRWLVQGKDLTDAKSRLRAVVGRMRDRGARVRIDVDPRDL